MFRNTNEIEPVSSLIAVEHHSTSYRQMALSFLVGTGATYLTSSSYGWMFSLAVGGIASAVCFAGTYACSRQTSIQSIPTVNENTKNSRESNSTKKILPNINNDYMSGMPPENLADSHLFYMGFCSKRGFADLLEGGVISKYGFEKSPFKHSSVLFVPIQMMTDLRDLSESERASYLRTKKGILVFGRQSTVFRTNSSISFWSSSFKNTTQTIIDNESFYTLFPTAEFEPSMTNAILSGEEIKEIVRRVNEAICKGDNQFCNMFHSNCYSASIYMLATAIDVLHNRHTNILDMMRHRVDLDLHPQASLHMHNQLEELCSLMLDVLAHNQGQGVINNKIVVTQINIALKIASEFDTRKSEEVVLKNVGFHDEVTCFMLEHFSR